MRSFRDKIRERALPYIPAGETYRISFPAETGLFGIAGLLPRFRVVVVTDRHIYLCSAYLWTVCEPDQVLERYALGALVYSRPAPFPLIPDAIHLGLHLLFVRYPYRDLLQIALAACSAPTAAR